MPDWTIRCGILFASLAGAFSAHASSGDVWQEFATEVQGKCEIAARAAIEFPHAIVDPFGSEHFGVALVTGKPKGANGFVSYFCIFDKRTKDVELGSELNTEQIRFLPEE
ncbi:hypothetical protein FZ934_02680 [Rhizobium grahamii]|uniref:DUF930 domain-containing protein n=1 Tax=Rhizobium grahamii TaxID=1120045 RepID=A0A5Q0C0P1_9HYPH|nr:MULTISPECIES: hypothetical protein [Rhizobium]QFY59436.1 hypothetical protein FZ934_02680 [Rhizobium grahamii]QRM48038.1 hypothetical protein F3Y33_01200 [Rhizobium sp. BG6]